MVNFLVRILDKLDFFTLNLVMFEISKQYSTEDYRTVVDYLDEAIAEPGSPGPASSSTSLILDKAQPKVPWHEILRESFRHCLPIRTRN